MLRREYVTHKLDIRTKLVSRTLCISSEREASSDFSEISAYASVLDIYFIRRHTLAKTL